MQNFQFIDGGDNVTVILNGKTKTYPKNYFYIESNDSDNYIKIFSVEHRVLFNINFGVDNVTPNFATKQELLDFLTFFFLANGVSTDGFMLKSVYDVNDDGVVDSAKEIHGNTLPNQYYGTNLNNLKGFYDLVSFVLGVIEANPVTIGDALVISSNITPPIITTTQNDYYPTGFDNASVVFISASGNYSLTGLKSGVEGRVLFLSNIGTTQIKLKSNNINSLPENRFLLNTDIILKPYNGTVLVYNATVSRWLSLNIS